MKALTVKDLAIYFAKEYEKGHQDYVVFVTDDEEGNGYHALWFMGQCASDMSKENKEYSEQINHDLRVLKDTKKAIYIG